MSLLSIVEQAVTAGFGEEEILKFLSNRVPEWGEGIKKAKASGVSPSKILKFLSYSSPKKGNSGSQEQQTLNDQFLSNIGLKTRQEKEDQRNKVLKNTLNVASGALGAVGISRGLPALARSGIGQTLLSKFGFGGEQGTQEATEPSFDDSGLSQTQNRQQQQTQAAQPEQLSQSPSLSPIEQKAFPSPGFQPETPLGQYQKASKQKAESIISELGIDKNLKKISPEGKNLEQLSKEVLDSLDEKQKKEYQKKRNAGETKPMIALLQDYFGNAQGQTGENQPSNSPMEIGANQPTRNQPETIKEPTKGDLVATPHGMGELKSMRNGQALIEDNGRLHKVKAEDLISSPLPEKDLADLHSELIKGIEHETGEDVSRMVNFAGYDPKTNTLAFLPHSGALYTYDDLTEEEVKQLTDILNVRKTSGENFIGAWKSGSKSPIGAAMSALIRKLQTERGGKGKEYSGKFETVYSALEPAILAAKKKKRKK